MLSGSTWLHDLHLLDVAVAAHAADAGAHVGAVVEVGVLRRACGPAPSCIGVPFLRAVADGRERRGLSRVTSRWQFMQTWVGGTLATGEVSTEAWQ